MASLADTTAASQAFERIRVAWSRNDPGDRPRLRRELEAFTQAFPTDGLAPLVRTYWVLSLMEAPADWSQAERRHLAQPRPPPGSALDVYLIAGAKLLRYHHQPEAAFELLRPIVGSVVDARARALLQEELTFDALEAREPYEAIAYMDAWLRGATEEDRATSEAKVAIALGAVPESTLRGSLEAMRASRKVGESHGYGIAIERLLTERLGQIAVDRGDATLARWLLDPEAGVALLGEEVSAALGQLATSRRGVGSVAGRTLGLVLPTSSAALRDEASEVLRGVLWAIDPGRDDAAKDAPVRLVTRDDAGDPSRLTASLEEVAGEGASVIIAALDPEAARRALDWSALSSLNVIVLALPTGTKGGAPGGGPSGFSVGEDWSAELDALAAALTSAPGGASAAVATLADVEAQASLVAAVGASRPLWRQPVSCDTSSSPRVGECRFPLAEWDRGGIQRWLVAGAASCADDLLRGLRDRPRRGVVALSLEASDARERTSPGIRVIGAAAGVVPIAAARADDPRLGDVTAMVARTGLAASWWAALGHDAAALAARALASLPANSTSDPEAIERRRATARQGLVDARAPLWTSDRDGFDATRALPRTIRTGELKR